MRNNVRIEYVVGSGLKLQYTTPFGDDCCEVVAEVQTQSDLLSTWNQLNILNFIREGILPVKETE